MADRELLTDEKITQLIEHADGSELSGHEFARAVEAAVLASMTAVIEQPPEPWVDVRGCGWHHYTPENIAAIVRDLRAVEAGTEQPEWINRDYRARCGILWRVISALSHDVPLNPDPVIASDALRTNPTEPEAWLWVSPNGTKECTFVHPEEDGDLNTILALELGRKYTPLFAPNPRQVAQTPGVTTVNPASTDAGQMNKETPHD